MPSLSNFLALISQPTINKKLAFETSNPKDVLKKFCCWLVILFTTEKEIFPVNENKRKMFIILLSVIFNTLIKLISFYLRNNNSGYNDVI